MRSQSAKMIGTCIACVHLIMLAISARLCRRCECNTSPTWNIGLNLRNSMGNPSAIEGIRDTDWVCENCFKALVFPKPVQNKHHRFEEAHTKVLDYAVKVLDADRTCMIKSLIDLYKSHVQSEHEYSLESSECDSFKKHIKSQLTGRGYK